MNNFGRFYNQYRALAPMNPNMDWVDYLQNLNGEAYRQYHADPNMGQRGRSGTRRLRWVMV
jgi:hypothetical protein